MQQLPRKVFRKKQERQLFFKRVKTGVAATTSTVALAGMSLSLLAPQKVAAANNAVFKVANEQDFIRQVASYASKAAANNDLYASVMIAQAILESGWGSSALAASPNHNLFGIKGSYNGQTVYMNTSEYLNGKWVTRYEPFRKYPSYYESFQDNANVLKNTSFIPGKYYYAGAWKSNTTSYRDATAYLTGRYATDPGYGGKLNTLIERYGLTAYDMPSQGGQVSKPSAPSTPSTNGGTKYYIVQAGDSFWGISRKNGLTLNALLSLNGLSVNHVIHPGDRLIIAKGTSTPSQTVTPEVTPSKPQTPVKPAVPSGPSRPSTGTKYYTVQKGDSYWRISHRYGLSVNQLLSLNGFDANHVIHPGDKLVVQKGTTNTQAPTTPQTTPTTTVKHHQVKKGDTLWGISKKHGVSISQLKSLNQLSTDLIYVGQTLKVK